MNVPLVQDSKRIRYAIVEIVLEKGDTKHIERGLFRGLKSETEIGSTRPTPFVWLAYGANLAKMCSLDSYAIVSIEVYDGEAKIRAFFMSDEDEQKEAKALLRAIKQNMRDIINKEDPDIIDTKQYEDVPEEFGGEGIKFGNQSTSPATTYQQKREAGFRRQATGNGVYSRTFVRKDPEPTMFKRKSRKPSRTSLQKLVAKLDLIAKGEYECKLPKAKGDQEEEREETKTGTGQAASASGAAVPVSTDDADMWEDQYGQGHPYN